MDLFCKYKKKIIVIQKSNVFFGLRSKKVITILDYDPKK